MKKIKKPEFPKDYNFNEMVDALAGDALLRLISGDNWRSIIFMVCNSATRWAAQEHKK